MPHRLRLALFCLAVLLYSIPAATAAEQGDSPRTKLNKAETAGVCDAIWTQHALNSFTSAPLKIQESTLKRVPLRFRSQLGAMTDDPRQLFQQECGNIQSRLVKRISPPLASAPEESGINNSDNLQQQVASLLNTLQASLYDWLALHAGEQISKSLTAEERAAFTTGNDPVQTRQSVHTWLNQPQREVANYVAAYLLDNPEQLEQTVTASLKATSAAADEIVEGFAGIMVDADIKLQRIGLATGQLQQSDKSDTPYTRVLADNGFSGEWLDNFLAFKDDFAALGDRYSITDASKVILKAFKSDRTALKVDRFFNLIGQFSGDADSSALAPLFSGMNRSYARIGSEMLAAIDRLGDALRKRSGYCIGGDLPVIGDKSDRSTEARQYAAQFPERSREMICPLEHERYPYKHIYSALGEASGRLFFWDGEKFIVGHENGGGREGIQAALETIAGAKELNYQLPELDPDGAALTARVYNTDYPGGIIALRSEAAQVMAGLIETMDKFNKGLSRGDDGCSRQNIIADLQQRSGLDVEVLAQELEEYSLNRLINTYAASYVAGKGGFGRQNRIRQATYLHYRSVRQQTRSLQFRKVYGQVRDARSLSGSCTECASATIDIYINGGSQVGGCEVNRADDKGNFILFLVTDKPDFEVRITADAADKSSAPYPLTAESFIGGRFASAQLLIDFAGERAAPEVVKVQPPEKKPVQPQAEPKPQPEAEDLSVPDFSGLSITAAYQKANAAGFSPEFLSGEETTNPVLNQSVARQEPSFGSLAQAGSRVKLYIYSLSATGLTAPDFTGMTGAEAEALAREHGLKFSSEPGRNLKPEERDDQVGQIYEQLPAPGQPLRLETGIKVKTLIELSRECNAGFIWNEATRRCIDNSPEAQIARSDCSAYPGTTPQWNKELKQVECSCAENWIWDANSNSCIDNSREAQVARADCSSYGTAAEGYWDPTSQEILCRCRSGYSFNAENTCVADPPPEAPPKGDQQKETTENPAATASPAGKE